VSLLDMEKLATAIEKADVLALEGKVVRCAPIMVEAQLPGVGVGTSCDIRSSTGRLVPAEVVGFSGPQALLMPFGEMTGICEGCAVIPRQGGQDVPVGEALLGRVVDSAMRPVDGGPALFLRGRVPLQAPPPNAMSRRRIHRPLELGVRAIDTCLTLGEGQRMGIFAGPGVGKSVLMGMVARACKADIIVVGLVGERGREVREFVERDLGPEGLRRSVVVVATADEPPLVRIRAAMAATALAEWFRSRGKKVMLLVDSLTRVAMAQREVGLAAGEPPTSRGYPPSTFAVLPRLLERAGNGAGEGSITALYTVLAEGDDLSDPVVDNARAALDGHIVLSRRLAGAGQFPAVDILQSVSRVMTDICKPEHLQLASQVRDLMAAYRDSADLIEVGAYVAGSNPRVDRAIACRPSLIQALKQAPTEWSSLQDALELVRRATLAPPEPRRA